MSKFGKVKTISENILKKCGYKYNIPHYFGVRKNKNNAAIIKNIGFMPGDLKYKQ